MGKKHNTNIEIAKGADESIDQMDSFRIKQKERIKKKLIIILVPLIIVSIVTTALCVFYFGNFSKSSNDVEYLQTGFLLRRTGDTISLIKAMEATARNTYRIPEGVTELKARAFYDVFNQNLMWTDYNYPRYIEIPNTVNHIEDCAIGNSTIWICFKGTKEEWDKIVIEESFFSWYTMIAFYDENEPTGNWGETYHYNADGSIEIWK